MSENARIVEAVAADTGTVSISVDGAKLQVPRGRSVLAAILLSRDHLRLQATSGTARAGFCLMGLCQECWIWRADGTRLRACTTVAEDGMALHTGTPPGFPRHG